MNDGPRLDPVEDIDRALLGADPQYTRGQVAERAGVPLDVAEDLWQHLGFPHTADDDVAFTDADVEALRRTDELISLGILTEDSQAALVRTWGRSFARLAEWQVSLLAGMALEGEDPGQRLDELMDQVLPNVEELQSYVWRRHLASAAHRMLGDAGPDGVGISGTTAVEFVDIVGYTSHSKNLTEARAGRLGRVLRGRDDPHRRRARRPGDQDDRRRDPVRGRRPARRRRDRAPVTERGADEDDEFPPVRAGIAYGEVVSRLGDVYGPTVNIAARLTSVARPGPCSWTAGLHEVLSGPLAEDGTATAELSVARPAAAIGRILDRAAEELADLSPYSEAGEYRFRRMPRRSVKGYSKLEPFVLRRAKE